ncbi:MAG: SAF domain-containing protein [Pirellulales bacterium]
MSAATPSNPTPARHRPKSLTVFAAAFIAGAAAAMGVNRILDVQLAQRRPQVECEPIFVALRSLPQGSPVTVWDVALKDWPKAMLPGSALRASDSFEGFVLRHAIREGQPLLAVQLVRSDAIGRSPGTSIAAESFTAPVPAATASPPAQSTQADLWTPAEAVTVSKQSEPTPAEPAVAESHREAASVAPTTVATRPAPLPQATDTAASTAGKSPMPPSPTDIEPPSNRNRPTPVPVQDDHDMMAEAIVADVASMPSVMASAPGLNQPASTSPGGDAGRYLVVPERIALQADTSFTTPRPQPPGPPTARTAQETRAAPAPAAQRSRQTSSNGPPTTGRREPQAQQPSQQALQQRPQQSTARNRPAPTASGQRSWGEMFPNMAAGIEAMGSAWQKPKAGSTSGQPQAGSGQQSTRR